MAVPLGHKYKVSSGSNSKGGKFFALLTNKKQYHIVGKKYALSRDKTELIAVGNSLVGDFNIPRSVNKVKSKCFYGCKGLTSLVLSSPTLEMEPQIYGKTRYTITYKIRSFNHSFLGKVWEITPKTIILHDRKKQKEWFSTIDGKRIPEKVRNLIKSKTYFDGRLLISSSLILSKSLIDVDGIEYSEDGKTLTHRTGGLGKSPSTGMHS